MGVMGLEIRDTPRSPAQEAWDGRMTDWLDEGRRILGLNAEHSEQYKKKICSTCSAEQRVKRECASLLPGCDELECGHMRRAFARKYSEVIERNLEFHPLFVRIRLNSELGK